MRIPRTARANRAVWIEEPDYGEQFGFADTIHERDYPTHSSVLGPDGQPLEYEPRPPMGFRPRNQE